MNPILSNIEETISALKDMRYTALALGQDRIADHLQRSITDLNRAWKRCYAQRGTMEAMLETMAALGGEQ